MDSASVIRWQPSDYSIVVPALHNGFANEVARTTYDRVCRTHHDAPGFCLLDVGRECNSHQFRRAMVDLKSAIQTIHRSQMNRDLVYLSAGRFDQQETTKLHRDGGPEQCMLMLGYEPSEVSAQIAIADYSKCAFDQQLTPAAFLDDFNPMFAKGELLLAPYVTEVASFDPSKFQLVLINNSGASLGDKNWQGVLHTAIIQAPNPDIRRVVNSTMITSVPIGEHGGLSDEEVESFVSTQVVRRRGYDKPTVSDDG